METLKIDSYEIVSDEVKHEDVVIVINDFYNNSDICERMMPIPETPVLNYMIVKDVEDNSKDFYDMDYAL